MNIKTVLDEFQLDNISVSVYGGGCTALDLKFVRAVEQAVLQSLQIQKLLGDSERLDWIEKNAKRDPKMDGSHVYWPTAFNKTICGPSLRAAIDDAMEKQV